MCVLPLHGGFPCSLAGTWAVNRRLIWTPCAGEAVAHRILTQELAQLLFLVVALSMALTPFLAELGQKVGKAFDSHDMKARSPLAPLSLKSMSVAQCS